jgi:DNA polymerase-3 subunit epsilon
MLLPFFAPNREKEPENNNGFRLQMITYRILHRIYKFRAERRGVQNGYYPEPALASALSEKQQLSKRSTDWNRPLQTSRYVVFDTETTGFFPYNGDEIIAVGGVVIENGRICEEQTFHELVNPFRSIPPAVTDITGINGRMVADKPGICAVINSFLDFIGDGILVAHNADFDMAFLNIKLNWYTQKEICNPVIDTYKLSRALLPELPSHDLDSLLRANQIPSQGRHTALGDSLMTARLFKNFLDELAERRIETLKQLYYYLHLKDAFGYTP